ncbi:MAG TPA: KpsF/GutQ family sugar-phosphate isomerase [Pyrinomonadaceae bacterium]|jgi:arabinose-5-phosphate isomerase|nr:KpsF/GutQ family sugar-phosphate isomerase [Pyrinomonadaceae bacterium]
MALPSGSKYSQMDNYISQFSELLKHEAATIECAAQRLQPGEVARAVKLLVDCQGKVILTGIGKSGFIARKVAATLTSTGTRAVFLHPSDALHGDLGIVDLSDVVVLLSNSGETDEVLLMLPYLKHRAVPLIAIVGKVDSTVARNADAVLDASVDKETCPFNLAPTASTTVALAIGDALALTVMQIKGLTPDDFALNHPAGRLGKRLSLKVADLMRTGADNPTVLPSASWLEVVSGITSGGLGAVNVVNDEGLLVGIITDGDLRRAIQKSNPAEIGDLKAEMFMTSNPITITPDELAYTALQLMENRPSQISVLPVMDNGRRSVGLLRLHDLVRSGL